MLNNRVSSLFRYYYEVILIAIACIVAIALNHHVNLFGDDFITFEQIRNYNMFELVSNLRYDAHPPIFYILLKLYSGLVGTSILALKSFNVVSYVILIIGTYLEGRLLGNRRFALISACTLLLFPCMLNNPILFLRMYLLASLFIMSASVFAYQVYLNPSKQNRCMFILFSICACFTHYYGAFFVAIVHLILYVSLLKKNLHQWKWCITYSFAPIAVFLIWLPIFYQQLFLKIDKISDKTPFLSRLLKSVIYPFHTGTHLPDIDYLVYFFSIGLLLITLLLVFYFCTKVRSGYLKINPVEKVSLCVSIGLPIMIMILLVVIGGLTRPIWFGAYVTLFFPLMALGLGYMVYQMNRRWLVLWFIVLSICFAQKVFLQYEMCKDTGYADFKSLYDRGVITNSDIILEANQATSIYFDKVSQYNNLDTIPDNWYRFQYDHIKRVEDYHSVVKDVDRFFSTKLIEDASIVNDGQFKLAKAFHFEIAYFWNNEVNLYLYQRRD